MSWNKSKAFRAKYRSLLSFSSQTFDHFSSSLACNIYSLWLLFHNSKSCKRYQLRAIITSSISYLGKIGPRNYFSRSYQRIKSKSWMSDKIYFLMQYCNLGRKWSIFIYKIKKESKSFWRKVFRINLQEANLFKIFIITLKKMLREFSKYYLWSSNVYNLSIYLWY